MGRIKGARQIQTRTDATFDTAEALRLRFVKHLSYESIARSFGVHPKSVWKRLKRFHDLMPEPALVQAYREQEPDMLDALRMKVVVNMADPVRLQRAALRDLAVTLGILVDKSRLMRGQSTANIGVRTTVILQAHGLTKSDKPEDDSSNKPT